MATPASPVLDKGTPDSKPRAKATFMLTNKRMTQMEREMKEWKANFLEMFFNEGAQWKKEKESLNAEIQELKACSQTLKEKVSTLERELANKASGGLEEGEFQPSVIEEIEVIKEQVRMIKEEEKLNVAKTSSWADMITETQKKADEAERWIEVAKKGKDKEYHPPTPTLINMTLEEEQRRRVRSLHVRVTGLKDTNNVDKEVATLMSTMGVEKPMHTRAWRVGKRSEGSGESSKERGKRSEGSSESSKERALILRFPSLEEKKDFLKKRPALKKTGIFIGDDLTLSQLAHMREVMPEIRAAREKGKMAFYRDGRVVITERRST